MCALCDSAITRIILTPGDEPLNLGRATRTWTPAQRKAITARDKHCTWAHCHRPAAWCEIDHITPWWQGGPTNIDNGRLLCLHHHRLRHQGWQLTPNPNHTYTPTPPDDWHYRQYRQRRRRKTPAA